MSQGFASAELTSSVPTQRLPATSAEPLTRGAEAVGKLLATADVRIGGDRPFDLQVHDPRFYRRVITGGMVGLGDAYVDGWWDCDAIDVLADRCLRAGLSDKMPLTAGAVIDYLRQKLTNLQRTDRARRNVEAHYQLGDDLFKGMLDERMMYTCGYWKDATTLAAAQDAKLELICRKIDLRPGQKVLDIGCGWGGFARYAAERHGAEVVGVTLSRDQVAYGTESCKGLPVDIRLQDYRDVTGTFDHVVSIGCFEHAGLKNHRTFMEVAHRCLKDDGLLLLHFFATHRSFPSLGDTEVLWVQKHIFPGIVVPSLQQVGKAVERLFITEDLHNFGADYDPTLMAWFANFDRNWPSLEAAYGPRFYRLWKFYLQLCAGAFRARKYQLWQFVFSKQGVPGGYRSVR